MKKIYILFFFLLFSASIFSQTVCNPSGNLVVFTNYDGGVLNIVVDVNIPNLKIGVCSYEGTTINISGAYASNVTGVAYAGYNGSNPHCGSSISTSISGSGSASTNIAFAPTATLSNTNGYGLIICGSTCSTTTDQGGCNTIDQIETYFLNYFPGSQVYSHKVQYGCWSGNQNLTTGGTCCGMTTDITSLSEGKQINVYPNPTSGLLSIAAMQSLNNATISIVSVTGQLIRKETEVSGTLANVDVTALSEGLYFVVINDQGKITRLRFIKK